MQGHRGTAVADRTCQSCGIGSEDVVLPELWCSGDRCRRRRRGGTAFPGPSGSHLLAEIAREEGESAGTATDVYGLGSVMRRRCPAEHPSEGPDNRIDAMLRRKMSGSPPLLASGPDDLNALVT
jgi:hypothetical protein